MYCGVQEREPVLWAVYPLVYCVLYWCTVVCRNVSLYCELYSPWCTVYCTGELWCAGT